MKNVHPAAVAAANWWADMIGMPHATSITDNNGPDAHIGAMFTALSMMSGRSRKPSKEQAETFTDLLAKRVTKALRDDKEDRFGVTLSVDYGPEWILRDVADEAHVGGFPPKTSMWVRANHVTVSVGYQAETRLVWASDEWLENRPICTRQRWDEAKSSRDYRGDPWSCSKPMYHDGEHVYDRAITLCGVCGWEESHWSHCEKTAYGEWHECQPA